MEEPIAAPPAITTSKNSAMAVRSRSARTGAEGDRAALPARVIPAKRLREIGPLRQGPTRQVGRGAVNQPAPMTQFQPSLRVEALGILARSGVPESAFAPDGLTARSPITGEVVAHLSPTTPEEAQAAIGRAHEAFLAWRTVPAPRRGELVRLLGEELRAAKADLGRLVTFETGKIVSEGLGEVQEMIDICDFAVGLSRQLYGLTIATERPDHRMMETWHPLGICGVISAFNFPVAVWSWNAALALVAGDACVWKPSEKTPLTALAVQALFD